jgi:hypothetical protein
MATLVGSISVSSIMSQASASNIPGGQPVTSLIRPKFTIAVPAGTAGTADNCDVKYSMPLTLAGTPTVLDLTNLKDVLGNAISFGRVRSITITNLATGDTFIVHLGYATTTANAWTALVSNPGQLTIAPSSLLNPGVFVMIAPNTTGYLVTSTSKLLNLDPGANTIPIQIEITGCSV